MIYSLLQLCLDEMYTACWGLWAVQRTLNKESLECFQKMIFHVESKGISCEKKGTPYDLTARGFSRGQKALQRPAKHQTPEFIAKINV